jgi:hypothetical protein
MLACWIGARKGYCRHPRPVDRVDQATRSSVSSPHERIETYQSGLPYPNIVGGWTGAGLSHAELPIGQRLIQLQNGLM